MQVRIENVGYTGWSAIGENVAAGQTSTAIVVDAWINSDGHYRNFMDPNYDEIGIGYFYTSGGVVFNDYWTQNFGLR